MFNRECLFYKLSSAVIFIGLSLGLFACGNNLQIQLQRGEEFLQKRKFQQALMEFRAAADINKDSAEAHFGLARSFENLGQIYDAIQALEQVIRITPENLEAHTKLGNYYLVLTPPQLSETQRQIEQIFAVNPNYVEGHILQASLLSAQNRPESEVLAVLNRAVELEPNRVESYISLARFFMKQNKASEAEQTLQKAVAVNQNSPLGHLEYGRFLDYAQRPTEAEAKFKKAVELAPDNYEVREAIARFYLSQRQNEKAEQAYKDLAQILGNSPEGLTELANFYKVVGREDEAIATLENILKDAPEFAAARYRLGEIYLDRKEFGKVREQVEILLSVNDSDSEALMLRARVKLQNNETEAAVKDLEEVLKRQPSSKSALFYMAQARLVLGQVDQARAFIGDLERYHPTYLYAKLLKVQASLSARQPEQALQNANQLIEAVKTAYPNPDMSAQEIEELKFRAISARGLAYYEIGKFNEARADFAETVKLSPNAVSAMINLAKVSGAQNNFAEAESLYRKALNADKKNFDALNGLVNMQIRQNQFQPAQEQVDRALAENVSDTKTSSALHFLKSEIFKAQGNFASAEAELNKSIEADEDYLPAYSSYAAIYVRQNQIERAVEQYKRILEKKPSAAIYTLLGMLEDARQNFTEAEKNYREALKIEPATPIAANNLAWLICESANGNLDEALGLAQSAVDKSEPNAGYYDTLGWIYYKKGLLSPAVEKLRKAVDLEDAEAARRGRAANSVYRLRLGKALAQTGDKPSAKKEVETALQKNGLSGKELEEAKNLLATL